MQNIRKIVKAISEKIALPTNQPTNQPINQPIITNNTDLIGPRWRRYKKIIKSKWQWENILKFQYRFIVHNTQLNRRQSTHYYGLKIQFSYQNLENIEIFRNLWLRFWLSKLACAHESYLQIYRKATLLADKFAHQDPNDKIWHGNRKI